MLRLLLIYLAYCALNVFSAPPSSADHRTNHQSQSQVLKLGDDKPCTWDDTFGEVDCGSFTITFGDGSFLGWKLYTTLRLSNFSVHFDLNCTHMGDVWTTAPNAPGLPYVISIHGGNGCISTDFWWTDWDNLWIKYANQWVDVASDSRCTSVYWNRKGRRCVIETRPADPQPKSGVEVGGATVRG
ncbi:uncharacterized protein QC763_703990 [Podospora pseudopauciseta]|uniref:Uncharacterized protein n=2 Tax=Podospora TaxID=5144 RepID=A0ABR0GZR3_9PEZI|nr:hypothetical protein QC763_703990 [Podospora pseudopauciseta]KAK4667867.1 hypothetical protein QC764_703990 [Podospora pseudoanserina]